jgi:hypothetical protein
MVFREADPFQEAADALARVLDVELFEGELNDGGLVIRVTNPKVSRKAEAWGFTAQ